MIRFQQEPFPHFSRRRLLCRDLQQSLQQILDNISCAFDQNWQVQLGPEMIFDTQGLHVIAKGIKDYTGDAKELRFYLKQSTEAIRDYYSHNSFLNDGLIDLPIKAKRTQGSGIETVEISLPEVEAATNFPASLAPHSIAKTPLGLLLPYSCDHDFLFANQIAIIANIAAQVRKSPFTWLRAVFSRHPGTFKQRVPLYWKDIHPSARIHPTAVIEGSIIGPHCRIGAHCTVRYSVLGKDVVLQDGAKVEYSAIDDGSWLMHDLVLYRVLAEKEVFAIHGPYQFSYFQNQSAAFANIMMDYRPDAQPIKINSPSGVRAYQGRFLGALLEEGARVFGGTLTAPGITVPAGKDIIPKVENIVRAKDLLK